MEEDGNNMDTVFFGMVLYWLVIHKVFVLLTYYSTHALHKVQKQYDHTLHKEINVKKHASVIFLEGFLTHTDTYAHEVMYVAHEMVATLELLFFDISGYILGCGYGSVYERFFF